MVGAAGWSTDTHLLHVTTGLWMTSGESKDLIPDTGGCNAMCVSIFTTNVACIGGVQSVICVMGFFSDFTVDRRTHTVI